jgi:hypothetical protein
MGADAGEALLALLLRDPEAFVTPDLDHDEGLGSGHQLHRHD